MFWNISDLNLDDEPCTPGDSLPDKTDYDPYANQNFSALSIPVPIPVWEMAVKLSVYALAFLVAVCGNSVVILIIVLNKRMRTTTNMLILNLAVSDLMVACFCMWVHAGNSVTIEWPFGLYVCKGNIFIQVTAVTSSVLTLTAISVERFFAIVFPMKPRLTPFWTGTVVAANWTLAIAMGSPHLFVRHVFEYYWADRHQVWCTEAWPEKYISAQCDYDAPGRRIYYTVLGVVMYFIPIVVMLCAYAFILAKVILRRHPGLIGNAVKAQERSRNKVIRMLLIVLLTFITCWTPHQIFILWDLYRERKPIASYVLDVKYAAVFVAYCNSSINPILYGGFNENFRRGFRDAFKCLLWKKRNQVSPVPVNRLNPGSNTTAVNDSNV